jgi:Uma2 family endonuclease
MRTAEPASDNMVGIRATIAAEGFARRAFTVEEVARMIDAGIIGEDEKLELIEGEIVVAGFRELAHERIKSVLAITAVQALPDHLTIGVATTLRLTNTTMLEPDIAVFPKELFRKSSVRFAELHPGQAALVIEVAASSLAYDKGLKARLYARHRVKEFWVVDANAGVTWVHTGPAGDGWSSIIERGPNEVLTTPTLPGFSIRLDELD